MEYRLNTYISGSGYCSRREADRFIESGNVTINGKRASIGARIYPGQKVRVNGILIENDVTPVYIVFNKPVGIVCSTNPSDKDNIIDYISHEQRIFPIGRIDKDSQGLILLTNDGEIVNKILRAGNNHKKDYIVTVDKPITDDFITRMAHGVPILDRVTRKCVIEKTNQYTFKISLIQGLNRQIRRMCEYFGYEVTRLERIQVMNIRLDKLGQGNWRDLTVDELSTLFDLIEDSEKNDTGKKSTKKVSSPSNAPTTDRADKKVKESKTPVNKKTTKPKDEDGKDQKKKKKSTSVPRIGKQRVDKIKDKIKSKRRY